jgi:hypothetical protein
MIYTLLYQVARHVFRLYMNNAILLSQFFLAEAVKGRDDNRL